jgi:hypothetical protein
MNLLERFRSLFSQSNEEQTVPLFARPARRVSRVFLHCSASNKPEHDDISVIRDWHLKRGFIDVGYHYFIKTDGTLQLGRGLEHIPAAQSGHNSGTIAICLHGLNESDFTEAQFHMLRDLCFAIDTAYNGAITFHGHCEVANKLCPVFDYKRVLGLDTKQYLL